MENLANISASYLKEEQILDPSCDPNHPRIIVAEDIAAAHDSIRKDISYTPCEASRLSEIIKMDVFLKKDFMLYTGSCKERGARYALMMLDKEARARGVICSSNGNHAQSLAYHGMQLGIPVTVVMPIISPIMKISQCHKFHANVIVRGKTIVESKIIAMKMVKSNGFTYINGYDHPHVIAGQGTMGLEIVHQVSDIDAVVIPVGGGGLICGSAVAIKAYKPDITIIGVEPSNCPSYTASLRHGKPISVPSESSLAQSLAIPMPGYNAFATAHHLVDKMVIVEEDWIALAILRMTEVEKVIVEGAGAITLAAVLAGKLNELKGKRVVLAISGGNIDTSILGRCLERGLAADGRLIKVVLEISDRPGGITDLMKNIADIGVTVKDIIADRAWVSTDVFSVQLTLICETRDPEHSQMLKNKLSEMYSIIRFVDNTTDGLE